jgi:hypothetical protein
VTHLEDLILALAEGMPDDVGGPQAGVRVEVTSVDLTIPVETHVGGDGLVRASLPRGRLATGHDVGHSRMTLRFDRQEDP